MALSHAGNPPRPARVYCSKCGANCTAHYVMCDVMPGQWCRDCFPWARCEKKHGEGCATLVFDDAPAQPVGEDS